MAKLNKLLLIPVLASGLMINATVSANDNCSLFKHSGAWHATFTVTDSEGQQHPTSTDNVKTSINNGKIIIEIAEGAERAVYSGECSPEPNKFFVVEEMYKDKYQGAIEGNVAIMSWEDKACPDGACSIEFKLQAK